MAELFDLYNEKLEPLGEVCERGDPLPRGKYHIIVNILPVNFQSKLLITKRALTKNFGGLWEITGGAVIAGETPLQAAVRELKEETGLTALPEALDCRGHLIFKSANHNHINIFYLFRADFHEDSITLQPGETDAARFVFPAEIERMAKDGEFIPYLYLRAKTFYPDIFGEKMP